jgi:ABC-type Zn uptake system ZnuABC Zn-binding protein ZnuA
VPARLCRILLWLVLTGVVAAGCGDGSGSDSGRITVVATTTEVADLVQNVGGDRVDVDSILTSGADPHDYEPRPSDAAALAKAAVVFKSGGDVDAWLDGLLSAAGGDAEVVELIDSVKTIKRPRDAEPDPHWWENPRNAILAVAAIRDALIDADPEGRKRYTARAAAYTRELERLDEQIAGCIERVPLPKRRIVTTHDALGPYADRYGIEVIGTVIPSLSTQAQPSAKDVSELADRIRDEGVETLFPEAGGGARLEQALARETGATVGPSLWTDTLGPEGSPEDTYIGAMAANTEALVDGMSGGATGCRPAPG